MYLVDIVAYAQSMVRMKNAAKAFAPAAVCWVATTGMIGGSSPWVLGPVLGTPDGSVGVAGEIGDEVVLGVVPVPGVVVGTV